MTGVFITFVVCAAVYIGFTIVLIIRGGRKPADAYLTAASTITSLWASTMAFLWSSPDAGDQPFMIAARTLEAASIIAWVLFVAELALPTRTVQGRFNRRAVLLTSASAVCLLYSILELALLMAPQDGLPVVKILIFVARLWLALIGLAVIENLIRNATEEGFWSVKYLGI